MGYIARNVSPPRQWNNEYKFRHILRKCFCPDIICSSRRYVCDDCLSSWRRTWTSIPCGTECHWIFCIIFSSLYENGFGRSGKLHWLHQLHSCLPKNLWDERSNVSSQTCKRGKWNSEVELAIAQCPVQAISWEERKLKKQSSTGGLFSLLRNFGKKSSSIQLLSKRYLTKDVALFQFSKPRKNALPGQFYTLQFQNSGKDIQRSYSLFDEDEALHFLYSSHSKWRRFSYPSKFRRERTGEIQRSVRTISSSREFFPKVFIATGTGVAPIFMMLQRCPKIFRQRFSWSTKWRGYFSRKRTLCLSKSQNNYYAFCSFWAVERIERTRDGYSSHPFFSPKTEFYLCGNPNMIEDGRLYLQRRCLTRKCLLRTLFQQC